MKVSIKQSDCKFIVKPENRVVICKIDSLNNKQLRDVVLDFATDISQMKKMTPYVYGVKRDILEMPASFTGIARCSEEDEWDEGKGKKLAFYRAKNKFYNSFFKRANMLVNQLDELADLLAENFNALGDSVDDNLAKLSDYLDDEEE